MPKFDLKNQQAFVDFQITEPPLVLNACKTDEDIALFIKQELKKILVTTKVILSKK